MTIDLTITGARWLGPSGLCEAPLSIADGLIAEEACGQVELPGKLILPGIVDLHGDGFERHLAPRRGAMTDLRRGLISAEAELAANGITTAVLAQFYSWEGGLRDPEFAARMLAAFDEIKNRLDTEMHVQLRLETHMLDAFDDMLGLIDRHAIKYVAFNDHLPHEHLSQGKRPPRLIGTALKSGRNPEKHLALMHALHARRDAVPAALDAFCATLGKRGVTMASHDAGSEGEIADWLSRGVHIAEFPETRAAAEAAIEARVPTILGGPNVTRGASHKGKVSARELVRLGLCTALSSDYHYPAPRNAAFDLVDLGLADIAGAWAMVSAHPAEILNLSDRGILAPGKRADLIILDDQTRRVEATLCGGRFTYLAADSARRFVGMGLAG